MASRSRIPQAPVLLAAWVAALWGGMPAATGRLAGGAGGGGIADVLGGGAAPARQGPLWRAARPGDPRAPGRVGAGGGGDPGLCRAGAMAGTSLCPSTRSLLGLGGLLRLRGAGRTRVTGGVEGAAGKKKAEGMVGGGVGKKQRKKLKEGGNEKKVRPGKEEGEQLKKEKIKHKEGKEEKGKPGKEEGEKEQKKRKEGGKEKKGRSGKEVGEEEEEKRKEGGKKKNSKAGKEEEEKKEKKRKEGGGSQEKEGEHVEQKSGKKRKRDKEMGGGGGRPAEGGGGGSDGVGAAKGGAGAVSADGGAPDVGEIVGSGMMIGESGRRGRRQMREMRDRTDNSAFGIREGSKANNMLKAMGWSPGEGLGKDKSGVTSPIKPMAKEAGDTTGIGADPQPDTAWAALDSIHKMADEAYSKPIDIEAMKRSFKELQDGNTAPPDSESTSDDEGGASKRAVETEPNHASPVGAQHGASPRSQVAGQVFGGRGQGPRYQKIDVNDQDFKDFRKEYGYEKHTRHEFHEGDKSSQNQGSMRLNPVRGAEFKKQKMKLKNRQTFGKIDVNYKTPNRIVF